MLHLTVRLAHSLLHNSHNLGLWIRYICGNYCKVKQVAMFIPHLKGNLIFCHQHKAYMNTLLSKAAIIQCNLTFKQDIL